MSWVVGLLLTAGTVAACGGSRVDPVLQRQVVPYVVVDGQATTLGGEAGVIGAVRGPVLVQVGHRLKVLPVGLPWPRPYSSDPAVLKGVSADGLGVFEGVKVGQATLMMRTDSCVRPSPVGCILVDVVVTAQPVPRTTPPRTMQPTTSVVSIAPPPIRP